MDRYVLGSAAIGDLEEIWEFIARDNPRAADRWIDRLFETFKALARAPGMGHRREDLTGFPVLFFPVDAYLVIYRLAGKQIEIVAVAQGSRDVPSFLHHRDLK